MYKAVLIAAASSGVLLDSLPTPAVAALESSAESNVGFVIYTKTLSPGTLSARWMFSTKYRGPGIATGGPKTGFAGRYHVRYFYDSGEFSDEYDLLIEKTDDVYKVSWIVKGKVEATGVGMEIDNSLAVGWRRVAELPPPLTAVTPNPLLDRTRSGVSGLCRTSFRTMRAMPRRAGSPECWAS